MLATRTARLAALLGSLAIGAAASAQTYSLTARATATGQPDVEDTTTVAGAVSASNTGGTTGKDNPSFVETSAEGTPRSASASAFAAAESRGPTGAGGGSGRVIARNDEISFNATEPFAVRVSIGVSDAISTAWAGDSARTDATANVLNPSGGGSVGFSYARINDGENDSIAIDNRTPGVIQMQPGNILRASLTVIASAGAVASNNVADGTADASINATLYIEVLSGTASIAGSLSGAEYGPPPCNVADLADPLGVLDLSDINAFVSAFTAQDPAADLDGSGVFDLADINAFVAAFSGGCP